MQKTLRVLVILLILCLYEQAYGASSQCLIFDTSTEPPHRKNVILEVDAFSTGTLFPYVIHARKEPIPIVHIQSTPTIQYEKFRYQFNGVKHKFVENIIFRGDIDDVILPVKHKYNVLFVIAGSEPGVILANQLSVRLGLINNGTRKSNAWRNKALMQSVIKVRGLESALTIDAKNLDTISTWIRTFNKSRWPVVLKPPASHGTDKVFFCNNEQEVRYAFTTIMGSKTKDGDYNASVIAQEYLYGDEFAVNVVGLRGSYYITEVWRYHKRPGINGEGAIYQYDEIVAYHDLPRTLREYAFNVLEALEISNGPAHLEIKMVPGRGPVLVEAAARFAGGKMPQGAKIATGTNQVELTAMAYLEPLTFMEKFKRPYELQQLIYYVDLYSLAKGKILKLEDFKWIKELPSYYPNSLNLFYKDGDVLPRTIDMSTAVGEAMLVNADVSQLKKDIERIIYWEENTFGK